MGVLFTGELSGKPDAGEADFSAAHVCPEDRQIIIRVFPQGGLTGIGVCNECYPQWADADLREVLR